jgi:hypothetical protein
MFNWNNVEAGSDFTFDIAGNEIIITPGQYDIDSLCAAIQADVRDELSDGSATCVFDNDLNRVVLTTTDPNNITRIGSGISRLTGLTTTGSASSFTGTVAPNTSLGDVFVSMSNWNRGRENETNKSFFIVIPKSALNSVPIYDNLYDVEQPVLNQTYSNYSVKLTNEYGLSMSGIEASLMLAFK